MRNVVCFVVVLFAASSAQQFNFQPQQSQNPQYRFTGQNFPTFSQQGSQQVPNFFRPSQNQFSNQQPTQAIQPPLPTFQQPPKFQQNNFQPSPQFQPTQQTFQNNPAQNFQSNPPQNFQNNQNSQQNFQNNQQQQQNFQNNQQQQQQQNFQGQQNVQTPQNFQNQQQNFQPQQQNFQNFQQPHNQQFQSSFTAPQPVPTFATTTPQQQAQPSQPSFVAPNPVPTFAATAQPPVTQTTVSTTTQAAQTTPSQEQLQRQYTQQLRQRQELLHQLDKAASSSTSAPGTGSVYLANGQKLQVVQVSPKASAATKPAQPAIQAIQAPGLLDAVTKGVVPSGVNYEVIRQKQDGNLENIKGLPSELPKKVTFVILEEQEDGSYKVQGVRKGAGIPEGGDVAAEAAKAASAAGEDETQEVQSLIKKLQDGQLKLPSKNSFVSSTSAPITTPAQIRTRPTTTTTTTTTTPYYTTTATVRPFQDHFTTLRPFQGNSISLNQFQGNEASQSNQISLQVPSPSIAQLKKTQTSTSMADALRAQGLRSMAQFLEQVGLDRALNDSAPFTMFAPTDLAFRALLLELGGADRAQAKFKASPRLLSGLLLHHVIPGSFRVADLQDEMTGVSLAGTQLRVNVYSGTDSNFNTRKVVTINGGAVSDRSADISLPGGSVAHAVGRVLFPLPVGDLLTSLEADPARRFSKFVRAIRDSGLEEVLKAPAPDSPDDGRTFTVFAPTDDAINSASSEVIALFDGAETPERRSALRTLLERHIAPGSLFSEGVNYYQATSTLSPDTPVRLFNDNGVFRVNSARVVSQDIPSTNGVIHAIDALI